MVNHEHNESLLTQSHDQSMADSGIRMMPPLAKPVNSAYWC